jgi:hypothetical protein
VSAQKITEPMRVLVTIAKQNNGVIARGYYPAGQERLIIAGLFRRELIKEITGSTQFELTDEGWAL